MTNAAGAERIFREAGGDPSVYGGFGEILNLSSGGDEAQIRQLALASKPLNVDAGFNQITAEFKKRQAERNRIVMEFKTKNPFVYDEVLAQRTAQAKEQLDPFYNQTLSDFLQGINRQRGRSIEDERRIMQELNTEVEQYQGNAKVDLQLALEKAGQGTSQLGLYQSGIGQRAQGLAQRESGQSLETYLRGAQARRQQLETTQQRNLEDIQTQQNLGTRDIERERTAQEKLLGGQMTQEAGLKYAYALRQALGSLADENTTGDILQGLTLGNLGG